MPFTKEANAIAEATARLNTTYGALLATAASAPEAPYFLDGEYTASFADLLEQTHRMAGQLSALGVRAGDRVVLWLPNSAAWMALFFACGRLGAVVVMAGTRLRGRDVAHIVADSGASVLLYQPRALGIDFESMVFDIDERRRVGDLPGLAHIISVRSDSDSDSDSDSRFTRIESIVCDEVGPAFDRPDSAATVCYTSGTTGRPKGCVQSHRALIRNGLIAAALTGLNPTDRIVCPVPFAHVFGFHMAVLEAALARATVVNADPFSAARLLDAIATHGATVLYMVPAMARDVLALQRVEHRNFPTPRLAVVAGASVSSSLTTELIAESTGLARDVAIVYGCSEAPTIAQTVPSDPRSKRFETVGRPTPGVEVLVAARGTSIPVKAGEVGEVLVKGYNLMLGYLNDAEATAAKYRDGWLVTDDLGVLDVDGYLQIAGRATDMFTVGGFNVYPREVEAQLEAHPAIVEAAVAGVPDDRLGTVPMAWLKIDADGVLENDILVWAKQNMASYKRPRYARIVHDLPRTSSGKISRVKIEHLARRTLPHLNWEKAND